MKVPFFHEPHHRIRFLEALSRLPDHGEIMNILIGQITVRQAE